MKRLLLALPLVLILAIVLPADAATNTRIPTATRFIPNTATVQAIVVKNTTWTSSYVSVETWRRDFGIVGVAARPQRARSCRTERHQAESARGRRDDAGGRVQNPMGLRYRTESKPQGNELAPIRLGRLGGRRTPSMRRPTTPIRPPGPRQRDGGRVTLNISGTSGHCTNTPGSSSSTSHDMARGRPPSHNRTSPREAASSCTCREAGRQRDASPFPRLVPSPSRNGWTRQGVRSSSSAKMTG